jgi:RNA polymerase sigma-70 factor (ECF subfamily)
MTTDSDQNEALVERARRGDPDAFGELVVHYASRVAAVVYQHVGDREATQDIGQNVFLKAFRRIGSLRAAGQFRAWLLRIAVNESVDFLRARHNRRQTQMKPADETLEDVPAPDQQPVERLVAREEREAVVAALDGLPPRQRSVFVLRHFQGLSNTDIAEALSCSTDSVKANLSYALKTLREKLGGANRE